MIRPLHWFRTDVADADIAEIMTMTSTPLSASHTSEDSASCSLHPPQPGDTNEQVAEFARSEGQQKATKEETRASRLGGLVAASEAEGRMHEDVESEVLDEMLEAAKLERELAEAALLCEEIRQHLPTCVTWTTPCSTRERTVVDDFVTLDGAGVDFMSLPVSFVPTRYYRAAPHPIVAAAADDRRPQLMRTRDLRMPHYINIVWDVEEYYTDWMSTQVRCIAHPSMGPFSLQDLDDIPPEERGDFQTKQITISWEITQAFLRHQVYRPEQMLESYKLTGGITSSITQVPMSVSEQMDPILRNEILVALSASRSTTREAGSFMQQARDILPRSIQAPPPGVYFPGSYVAPPRVLQPAATVVRLTRHGLERSHTAVNEFKNRHIPDLMRSMRNCKALVLDLAKTPGAPHLPNWTDPHNIMSAVDKRLNRAVNEAAPHRNLVVGEGGTYQWLVHRMLVADINDPTPLDELFVIWSSGYSAAQLKEVVAFMPKLRLLLDGTLSPADLTREEMRDHFSFKHFFKRETLAERKPPRFIMAPSMTLRFVYFLVNRKLERALCITFGGSMVKHLDRTGLADRVRRTFNGGCLTIQGDVSNMEGQMGGEMRKNECEAVAEILASSGGEKQCDAASVPFWRWFFDSRGKKQEVAGHFFHLVVRPMRMSGEGYTSSGNCIGNMAFQGAVRLRMYANHGIPRTVNDVMVELLENSMFEGDDSLMAVPQVSALTTVKHWEDAYAQACADIGLTATAVVEPDPLRTKFCKLRMTSGGTVGHDFWVWMRSMFTTTQRFMMDTNTLTPLLMRARAICQLAEPAPAHIIEICRAIIKATEPWKDELLKRVSKEALEQKFIILSEFISRVRREDQREASEHVVLLTRRFSDIEMTPITEDPVTAQGSAAELGPEGASDLRALAQNASAAVHRFFTRFRSDRDTLPESISGRDVPGPEGEAESIRWQTKGFTSAKLRKRPWYIRAAAAVGRGVFSRSNIVRGAVMMILGSIGFISPTLAAVAVVTGLGLAGIALLSSIVIPIIKGKSPVTVLFTFLATLSAIVAMGIMFLLPFESGRAILKEMFLALFGWVVDLYSVFERYKELLFANPDELDQAIQYEGSSELPYYVAQTSLPSFVVDWVESPNYCKILKLAVIAKRAKRRFTHKAADLFQRHVLDTAAPYRRSYDGITRGSSAYYADVGH